MNKVFLALVLSAGTLAGATVGGKTSPDGKEIQIDLPGSEHRNNISSRGQGCCTQTSLHHTAVWQNVAALKEFHEWVKSKGLPGGSYPGEMEKRIGMIAKERGLPTPKYVQLEGGKEVVEILRLACTAGFLPGVTYSFSPTGRYGGSRISHMVSLVHMDAANACILDNNYPGDNKYEWLSIEEFTRTFTGGGKSGWAVIVLEGGPPCPLPWN